MDKLKYKFKVGAKVRWSGVLDDRPLDEEWHKPVLLVTELTVYGGKPAYELYIDGDDPDHNTCMSEIELKPVKTNKY